MRRFLLKYLGNWVINLTLAGVTTIACFAAIEIYLRWSGAFDVQGIQSGCHVFSDNPKIMYELQPGCGDHNSFGMRDREYSLASSAFRIAVLGDSITYGPRVARDETYPSRLEQRLNADPGIRPTEVLNFGVNGYSTVQEVESLARKGLQFRPQLVILQYFVNDDQIYTTIFDIMLQDLRHHRLDGYVDALDQGRPKLLRWLATTRIALGVRFMLAQRRQPEPPPLPSEMDPKQLDWRLGNRNAITDYYQDRDPVRLGFSELRDLATTHRFPVLVVIFPFFYEDIGAYPAPYRKRHVEVMALCRSFGFHCLDLIERIEASEEFRSVAGLDLFVDNVCHLNARGHDISAAIIHEELKRLELLPPWSPRRSEVR